MIVYGNINEQVLSQIERKFPGVDRNYISCRPLEVLRHHVLVVLSRSRGDSLVPVTQFLALDTSGKWLHLGCPLPEMSPLRRTSGEGLLMLLRREGLRIEEGNCEGIVELFDLMYPQKRVLESIDNLGRQGTVVKKEKEDRVRIYADSIQSPLFSLTDEVRSITFWTIDYWTGNLEQWGVYEDSRGTTHIENVVLEAELISVLR
jgi:hypothetical protein